MELVAVYLRDSDLCVAQDILVVGFFGKVIDIRPRYVRCDRPCAVTVCILDRSVVSLLGPRAVYAQASMAPHGACSAAGDRAR